MRWVLLLLITANVGLLGFYLLDTRQSARQEARARDLPDAPRLQTLSQVRASGEAFEAKTRGSMAEKPLDEERLAAKTTAAKNRAQQESPALCYLVTGSNLEPQARQILELAVVAAGRLEEERQPREPAYQVYVPSPAASDAAASRVRKLADMGLDPRPLEKGPLASALSLGIFARREEAEPLFHLLRARGFEAQIYRVPRYHSEYRLWLRLRPDADLKSWRQTLAKTAPGLGIDKKDCAGLETGKDAE